MVTGGRRTAEQCGYDTTTCDVCGDLLIVEREAQSGRPSRRGGDVPVVVATARCGHQGHAPFLLMRNGRVKPWTQIDLPLSRR